MNYPKFLTLLVDKISNDIKRKYSNTYLGFQNKCNIIKINAIPQIANSVETLMQPNVLT